MDAGEIDVSVDDGMITISGTRTAEHSGDADGKLFSLAHVDELLTIELPKIELLPDGEDVLGDDMASLLTEAEALARESPRFARWLRVHGYLTKEEEEADALALGE